MLGMAYVPLPNAVYVAMKGDLEEGPIIGRDGPGFLGDLWESYATLLVVRNAVPDWSGIRSVLLRALIAQKEIEEAPEGSPHWVDEAKRWRPGRKPSDVAEPPDEGTTESSSQAEPEGSHGRVDSPDACAEGLNAPDQLIETGGRAIALAFVAVPTSFGENASNMSESEGRMPETSRPKSESVKKEKEDEIRDMVEQTVASERIAAERQAAKEKEAEEAALWAEKAAAEEERKTKNRFTRSTVVSKYRVKAPATG